MARASGVAANGMPFGRRSAPRRGRDFSRGGLSLWQRPLFEGAGFLLFLAALLLALALLTYTPFDASLDTATSAPARNFVGEGGAVLADLLRQSLGLSAFLLPGVLLGWALRLLLGRGLSSFPKKLALLPLGLVLGAFALSILSPPSLPFDAGGTVGWEIGRLLRLLAPKALLLPLAMTAAAALGLLLLFLLGLDWRDWTSLGKGAGRGALGFARLSRRGGSSAALWGCRAWRRWRERPLAAADESAAAADPVFVRRGGRAVAAAPSAATEARGEPRLVAPKRKPLAPGRRGEEERQGWLAFGPEDGPVLPALDLLNKPPAPRLERVNEEGLEKNARLLEGVLEDYGVRGQIVQVRPGPVVTLYELEPAPGIKASRVIGLADDIARSMSAISVRVALVPGRNVIGIELPNRKAEMVLLRELLDSPVYEKHSGRLPLILGKDIGGEPVLADLAKMPHLLIAGTTGSGKSVAINTMILSILYRMPPERCKFIMVDPKMLELSVYDGIPHLLAPVVTDPRQAVLALKWAVREMESRYRKMSKLGVRSIEGFNARIADALARGENLIRQVQTGFDPVTGKPIFETEPFDPAELPLIVVVVDEMADLMLIAGKEIEAAIQRLSQMARAAGIHLIMATQRPSVDVITGTIKANFPTRISFQVSSKIDSRTIFGEGGAEQLLGRGDMLYMAGGGRITRVHGPFVSDEEVERVVSFLKGRGAPEYVAEVTEDPEGGPALLSGEDEAAGDALYAEAVAVVCRERKASTSFVQRHLQIGYNRAARIIERMEAEGLITPPNHVGRREVVAPSGR
jgi:DNA segregation ATPase FtsK/SpoIIIE, S-DNA-T family